MARLPNGCSRMLCALLQFGSFVCAVNSPSPATARTRRRDPFTALSNRFSSLSSSTRSCPETTTNGVPIMSSQKIGPSSLAIRVICWIGVLESTDSMLPTTGFFGGCGIGLNLLGDVIAKVSPAAYFVPTVIARSVSDEAIQSLLRQDGLLRFARNDGSLPKPPSTPFDQFCADRFRLLLLRPMAAVP